MSSTNHPNTECYVLYGVQDVYLNNLRMN